MGSGLEHDSVFHKDQSFTTSYFSVTVNVKHFQKQSAT